ncbi:SCA7, zinc-binding domain-containing protein [Colletotrichum navitas]|uniref:SCA7, zinc-binding domain-containing protein n=1 Tax=Colletotrichum navitas TaxID=681940 RepID=A0AAD8V921_9PEZI|nr:SCA7, zinc-binding domain-containing protein [Colletotrichum navitas]KAK1597514.1 SCA7, zinc-binding domain-containing protein [Colletotrichum navitas]
MASARPEDDLRVADDPMAPRPYEDAAVIAPAVQTSRRRQPRVRPVDIERQCGVSLGENRRCGAALACRRHSMGAKRAVAGRSAPFDLLLAASLEERA